MAFYNQVVITGKVATPPQRRYRPDGTLVLQFPLELNDSDDSLEGGSLSRIPIVVFGELAESKTYIEKGQNLLVKGRLRQRRWQTKEGRRETITEVIAIELQTLEQ